LTEVFAVPALMRCRRLGVYDMFGAMLQPRLTPDPALAGALAEASAAIARLDEALAFHPLQRAFLHRARLDAVRRQAAVDGRLIDPWHLFAVLEGLRLRMDGALRIIDRGAILAAAAHALTLHGWLVAPDFDEEGVVYQAEKHLGGFTASSGTPLLAAATGMHAWLDSGGARPPIRAALVRFWTRHHLLRTPVPLTGAAALRADTPWARDAWTITLLRALVTEAADARQLLLDLERTWFTARASVVGRRRDSHVVAAVDLLAAIPLVSATTLAKGLGLAVKNAIRMLDGLVSAGIAVDVTHRSKRRLFGLAGLAPLAAVVRPPYRPEPGRGRGRPPLIVDEPALPPVPLPPLTLAERKRFDYSGLEAAMAHADQVVRQTRQSLHALVRAAWVPAEDRLDPARLADNPATSAILPRGGNEHQTEVKMPTEG
jgi:hypothetical protein